MTTLVAILLIVWEPLRFATELLSVLTTLTYRGWIAVFEVIVHAGCAALSAMAGLALLNGAPDARRLATVALGVSFARTMQSLYWSVLPNNSVPGARGVHLLVAAAVTALALMVVWRNRDAGADTRLSGRKRS